MKMEKWCSSSSSSSSSSSRSSAGISRSSTIRGSDRDYDDAFARDGFAADISFDDVHDSSSSSSSDSSSDSSSETEIDWKAIAKKRDPKKRKRNGLVLNLKHKSTTSAADDTKGGIGGSYSKYGENSKTSDMTKNFSSSSHSGPDPSVSSQSDNSNTNSNGNNNTPNT